MLLYSTACVITSFRKNIINVPPLSMFRVDPSLINFDKRYSAFDQYQAILLSSEGTKSCVVNDHSFKLKAPSAI